MVLGDVGGIQSILIVVGAIIAGTIAERMMYAELIK